MPHPEPFRSIESSSAARHTFRVSDAIRSRISEKAVAINVPHEMREVALDYVRDAGGVIVERSHFASWVLIARSRTERFFEGIVREKVIVDAELAHRGDDQSLKIVMRGRGEELYYGGHDWPEAVVSAGRQALDKLTN
jgi:hypothetical protein